MSNTTTSLGNPFGQSTTLATYGRDSVPQLMRPKGLHEMQAEASSVASNVAAGKGAESSGGRSTSVDRQPKTEWASVPKIGTVATIVAIVALGMYIYKTVKYDGVVVNEQTGQKRSIFRWVDIALGTFAALYILRSIRTLI